MTSGVRQQKDIQISIIIKTKIIRILTLCIPILVFSKPVISSNNSLSTIFSNQSNSNNASVFLRGEVPITELVGLSVNIGYTDTTAKDELIDASANLYDVGMFFKKTQIGMLSISALSISSKPKKHNLSKQTYESLTLSGSYYLKDIDLNLKLSERKSKSNSFNENEVQVSYYLNLNTEITASISDTNKTQSISLTYQPQIFNQTIALLFAYTTSKNINAMFYGVSYFFGNKESLKSRSREH